MTNPLSPFAQVAAMPRHKPAEAAPKPERKFKPAPLTPTPGPAVAGIGQAATGTPWASAPAIPRPEKPMPSTPAPAPKESTVTEEAKPKTRIGQGRKVLPAVDIAALQVVSDVPYSDGRAKLQPQKWEALFARLPKPGNSLALPPEYKGGISAAILKRKKDRAPGVFKTKIMLAKSTKGFADGDKILRVWRMA